MSSFFKRMLLPKEENKSKKKIENIVFLIIISIITIIIINTIWKDDDSKTKEIETTNTPNKTLAYDENISSKEELEKKLETILATIKNVGEVNVLINYSESSTLVPLYDETTTTSSTDEGDSSGGTRNVTETEVQKDVVFSESSGTKEPVTQKIIKPTIQGAIVTAEGANDATVKANIINAIGAVTGLSIDKIQVFELGK